MSHPHYSSDEIEQRGQELYDQQIRARVEADNKGKFLVLDIKTGEYEIDESEITALKRIKSKNPDAALYFLRVGYPTAYKLGGQLRIDQR